MAQPAKTKDDRIDLRVSEEAKQLIERAAAIAGMNVSTFTLSTTLRAAKEEIVAYERLSLSKRDSEVFLTAVESLPKANSALRSAMTQFARKHR